MADITRASKVFFLVLALSAAAAPTRAGVALKDYAAARNTEAFRQYLEGISAGFRQANAELQLRRIKRLYCEPSNSQPQFDTYISLLEKEVKENEAFYTVETPVETALLFGLMKAYPCR